MYQILLANDAFLLTKVRKVIESCKTSQQLQGATNFFTLAEKKIATEAGIEECLSLHAKLAMKQHSLKKVVRHA